MTEPKPKPKPKKVDLAKCRRNPNPRDKAVISPDGKRVDPSNGYVIFPAPHDRVYGHRVPFDYFGDCDFDD